jgi:type II secretory pathway pseudopilin PulG
MPIRPTVTEARGEAGFGLLELVVCVALLVAGSVFALALLPAVVRAAQAGLVRDAATGVARNALERARAAAAYAPSAGAAASGHAWAFVPQANETAAVRLERPMCGSNAAYTDVSLGVASTYDAVADTLTVRVSYPPDPCVPAQRATVALSAQLAPAAYAPQTELDTAVADPARQ